ncbi:MAG: DUF3429 family protein [Rhizobiales bacterium]|nr:DUF3429 family protein [Hyphomicrobiales bacterium]
MPPTSRIPRPALVLGWLGVLPFAALAVLAATGGELLNDGAMSGLVQYGLIILSFMGGAQWGLAMRAASSDDGVEGWRLAISVLPALAAFGLSLLPAGSALLGLAGAFVALLGYDVWAARAGMAPAWYPALRLQLTGAVVVCLLAASAFGFR